MNKYRYITNSGRSGYYKKWNEIEARSVESVLHHLLEKLVRIYDAATCGEDYLYVRIYDIANPEVHQYWVIKYSWYIDYDPEWELKDNYEFASIDFEKIPEYDRRYLFGDRDWIML